MPKSPSDKNLSGFVGDRPSTPAVQDIRNVVADAYHGLHDRALVEGADAMAHFVRQARASGVSDDEVQRMATVGFTSLLARRARGLRRWIRRQPENVSRRSLDREPSSEQRTLGPGPS